MSAEISVLLPYRDAEATLEAALLSVLAPRGPAREVLAVNDGSTDGGPAIARRLAAEDPRLRLLTLDSSDPVEGRGLVAALRAAARAARAPYLARMDADDESLPGRFEAQLALLRAEPRLGAVGTQVALFGEVGEGMRHYIAWQNGLRGEGEHARARFIESPLCHPSVMLRREAYEAAGGFRIFDGPEDYDLFLRLVEAGWGLSKVPRVLFRWRRGPSCATERDPRYAPERFHEVRARYLAPILRAEARPLAVWGAGRTGKRLMRALEPHGPRARCFIDIDPRKIGRIARGAPILAPGALDREGSFTLVAVGTRGARDEVRGYLSARGFEEGADFLCAA